MKLNVIFTSSIKAFIDSIDKRASQVDVSVNRKVILRKKFANISNLISERYFFRKVMPLSWATSAFCFVKNLLLKFYRNLSYLSNRSLPCFFVKIFLSNLRNTESKKFTVFCLFCQNIVLFEKPRFFLKKMRQTCAVMSFLCRFGKKILKINCGGLITHGMDIGPKFLDLFFRFSNNITWT